MNQQPGRRAKEQFTGSIVNKKAIVQKCAWQGKRENMESKPKSDWIVKE
jgi:hypothetical protein